MPEQNNSDFQIPTFDERADTVVSQEQKPNIIDINKVQRGLELACAALASNERIDEASQRLYAIADEIKEARSIKMSEDKAA